MFLGVIVLEIPSNMVLQKVLLLLHYLLHRRYPVNSIKLSVHVLGWTPPLDQCPSLHLRHHCRIADFHSE